jgi:hypothetical protein
MSVSNRLKRGFGGAMVLPCVAILALALPGGATADAKTSAKPSLTIEEVCDDPIEPHGLRVVVSGLEPGSTVSFHFLAFQHGVVIAEVFEVVVVDETGGFTSFGADDEPSTVEVTVGLPDGHTLTASREIDCSSREPASIEGCQNGGWRSFPQFKNQGDCVSFVATGGKNAPAS